MKGRNKGQILPETQVGEKGKHSTRSQPKESMRRPRERKRKPRRLGRRGFLGWAATEPMSSARIMEAVLQ